MKLTLLFLYCLISVVLFAGNKTVDIAQQAKAKEWVKNQPLEFIENKGQFTNTDGKQADEVLFKASYGSCDIYITTFGLSYVFVKTEDRSRKSEVEASENPGEEQFSNGINVSEEEKKIVSYYRLDMNLLGANINKANIIKENESKQGHYNYFYAHCPQGIYDVKGYGKITIKNIYPGIDWVIYTNGNSKEHPLKYDFVVHPKADYKDIRIKFLNAQNIGLSDNETKLNIHTIAGNIEEGNLISYTQVSCHTERSEVSQSEKNTEIESKYVIDNDTIITFQIAKYDTTKTLIIDPLVWATYYGGSGSEEFLSICCDSQNNIFVCGMSKSTDFPTLQSTAAFFQAVSGGVEDIVILKFSEFGVRIWVTYYGGSNTDYAYSICTDSQDNIFLTGNTRSSDFPTQQMSGAFWQSSISSAYTQDVILLKFTNTGIRLWASYYGGSYLDYGLSCCMDNLDNFYVTGYTNSSNFPCLQLSGAYWQPISGGSSDVFILKFDNLGVLKWASYLGGNYLERGYSIKSDNQNNIYMAGETASANFPCKQLAGAYWQSSLAGISDGFILKFNPLDSLVWATYYGGNSTDATRDLCFDSQNNLFIVGRTGSANFPVQQLSAAYWQPNLGGVISLHDLFIAKFNNLGACQWATYYGGSGNDGFAWNAGSICTDNHDNIFVTGVTESANFPVMQMPGEYWQPNLTSSESSFILMFNNGGTRQYATYYGSNTNSHGSGIITDHHQNLYNIGLLDDSNAYTIDQGNSAYYDSTFNGYSDGYILKISFPCYTQKPLSIVTNLNNYCFNYNGNITLTSFGGYGDTLKWYTSACGLNYAGKNSPLTITAPTHTTTYYARWESICDTSACDSIKIIVDTVFNSTLNPVICQGDVFHVGTNTYTVSGLYIDTLTSYLGCDSIITTNLLVNPKKQLSLNPVICQGDSYQVGTNTYSFTGVYTDTLTTYLGCDSIITCNLTVNPVKLLSINPSICQGDVFQVGTTLYTVTGIYSDTLTTFLGCDSIVTCNLTVNPVLQINIYPVICQGQVFQIGTNIYSTAGIYHDTISTYLGCDSIVTTNLTITAFPVVNLGLDTIICKGETLVLNAEIANAIYQWQDGSVNPTYTVYQQGLYWVKATIGSCSSSDTINVITNDCEIILQLPNIITPNGDGINDIFMPIISKHIKKMQTVIYNRWGNLLYETDNLNIDWDGTFNGKYVADGVYYWIVSYSDFDGKENFLRGSLTVMR
ncbi:MAG: SBBP repeat-containing protein [Bacteroidetes bacterium]|nr:SBBP repeat-containing protein [Bacteroidota bacterium]